MEEPISLDQFVEQAWRDLCEKDDRTSPEEYPEMCLITQDELRETLKEWSVKLVLS